MPVMPGWQGRIRLLALRILLPGLLCGALLAWLASFD
jgi:hypothetical protein